MQKNIQFRHGDLLIEKVNSIPESLNKQKDTTLAYGEVTGHHHTIEDKETEVFYEGNDYLNANIKFAKVKNLTNLIHQEHAPIKLEPGIYRVQRQREYSPEEIKQVVD